MRGEIKNAIIQNVKFGIDGHGILRLSICLKYGDGGQCFGGHALDSYDKIKECRVGSAYGTEYILRVMNTLKVYDLFNLKGTPVRADASTSEIFGIGHFIEDKWFYPSDLLKEYQK